jgi:Anti-sigma-K factor rskA
MSNSPFPKPSDEYLEELLTGYVLNALSCDEKTELESYLEDNPELIQRLDSLQEIMGLMAHSARMPAPPQLREKVLAIPHTPAVSGSPASGLPASGTPGLDQSPLVNRTHRRRSPLTWQKVGAAIAALLVITLGIETFRMHQQLTSLETELAEYEEQPSEKDYTFELKSKQVGSIAVAKVVVDIDAGEVIVGVQHLPPLPAGEAYHLWAFTADQKKILCGRFTTDASGQLVERLSFQPEDYASQIKFMRISREPAVTPPDAKRRVLVMTSES